MAGPEMATCREARLNTTIEASEAAAQALQDSEQRYRDLMDTLPETLSEMDVQGQLTFANRAAFQKFGYTDDDFARGISVLDLLIEEDRQRAASNIGRVLAGEELRPQEYTARRKDGSAFSVVICSSRAMRRGQPTGLVGFVVDISARRQAEMALRESEERYHALFEDSPISLWEEDFSVVKAYLRGLEKDGVEDISAYLAAHPEAIAHCISLTKVLDVNQASVRLYGASSKEQLLGLATVISPELLAAHLPSILAVAAGQTSFEAETVNRTLAGETLNILVRWSVAPGHKETYGKVLVSVLDISARRRAEASVQRSAQRLAALHEIDQGILSARPVEQIAQAALRRMRNLLACQQVAVLSFDPDVRTARVLASINDDHTEPATQLQMSLAEYGDIAWALRGEKDEIPDLTARTDRSPVAQLLLNSGLRSYTRIPLLADGALLGSLELGRREPGNLPAECLDVAREVADQLALAIRQAQLREAQASRTRELEALYDTSLEIGAEPDLRRLLAAIVQRAAKLLGVGQGALYLLAIDGQKLELAVRYNLPPQFAAIALRLGEGLLGRVAQSGETLWTENYREWPERLAMLGNAPFYRTLGVPLKTGNRVIGVIGLADESHAGAFSASEVRLARLFADQAAVAIEKARLYASLQETNAQLRSALQAKDEMIQNMSHELRTPLTLIEGYAELLGGDGLGPLIREQAEAAQVIHRQAQRLSFMVNRLLLLQTFEAKRLRRIALDPALWLAQALEPWQARAVEAGIGLQLEAPENLPLVEVDTDHFGQVIENLLDNAFKFSPGGGVVSVRAWSEANHVLFPIADQGVGIPADKHARVFERFYQAEGDSTRRFGGLGIGLPLCQKIVEAHGGRIWAESSGEGCGSTFCVSLRSAASCEWSNQVDFGQ